MQVNTQIDDATRFPLAFVHDESTDASTTLRKA